MAYAIIEYDIVANAVEASAAFAKAQGWIELSPGAGIGWRYEGGKFLPPDAPPIPVPAAVTMRQAKLALLAAGLLDDADAAIAGLPGTAGRAAQIEWEYASELRRDHTLVAQLGPALGLDTAAKIDALFIAAAQIA